MPGFPDRFMPFMDEPPGSKFSKEITGHFYGPCIQKLRGITNHSSGTEPKLRHKGTKLTTGYQRPGA
jgi:hydrogenase small subunit